MTPAHLRVCSPKLFFHRLQPISACLTHSTRGCPEQVQLRAAARSLCPISWQAEHTNEYSQLGGLHAMLVGRRALPIAGKAWGITWAVGGGGSVPCRITAAAH